jgi:hypothetical protein
VLFFSQPDHHFRERRDFHPLSIENCPNRFAIKSRFFGRFPQSTRADLCDHTFVSDHSSAVRHLPQTANLLRNTTSPTVRASWVES